MKRSIKTIYLDNAATTFPKPDSVRMAVERTLRYGCGNPGRSSHRIALRAAETVFSCRSKLATLFGGSDENVVFTSSATHSLNLAIKSALRRGDHVLISDIEHNSVLRPIHTLAEHGMISYDFYRASANPEELIRGVLPLIRPNTAMIVACHHSNICNLVQPLDALGALCRKRGILFTVDASQSAGILNIDMQKQFIDILCAPGHKGMYGIPGSGFVLFGERFSGENGCLLNTFTEGGNGIRSKEPFMPCFLPERLEAGTLPVPAVAALSAGIDFLSARGISNIAENEKRLYRKLRRGFADIGKKITVYGDGTPGGILLFSAGNIPSEELASYLDTYGICVRAGLHCAPRAHALLGTPEGGAVRVSFGAFNTARDVDALLNAVELLLRKRPRHN